MRTLYRPGWGLFLLALLLPWVSGCDQGTLTPPDPSTELFSSYVAIGNSITAGFQSGGINERTQRESYAGLLADQMDTPFNIPALAEPGCPPPLKPLSEAFPPEPISDQNCAFRTPSVSSPLHNVAVPQAAVIDVLTNFRVSGNDTLTSANELTSFILGGRTQLQAAKEAHPTFASVWIGNSDVLGAAITGDPALATSVDSFETRYSRMVTKLESIESLQGAVFVGVAPVTLIPHLSEGDEYDQNVPLAQQAGTFPSNFELNSCDGSDVLIPFRHGAALIGSAIGLKDALGDFAPSITLDCSKDRTVETTIRESIPDNLEDRVLSQIGDENKRISLLTPTEQATLQQRAARFNQIIQNQVAGEYAYVDPNPLFRENSGQIPTFPNLLDNSSPAFGPLFSLDGIHPSAETHRLIANEIIESIKDTYDVTDQELPSVNSQ